MNTDGFEIESQDAPNKTCTRVNLDFVEKGNISLETARLLILAYLYSKSRNGDFNIYVRKFEHSSTEASSRVENTNANLINWLLSKYKFEYKPFLQGKVNPKIYKEHAIRLIEKGFAYCVQLTEHLNEKNNYRGIQRNWKPHQILELYRSGKNYSIYFKMPKGKFSLLDALKKPKVYYGEELKDIMIMYCDKNPTSLFANAVDDYENSTTHIFGIRKEVEQNTFLISNLISSAIHECTGNKNKVCMPKHVLLDPIRIHNGELLSESKQINIFGFLGFKLLNMLGYTSSVLINDLQMSPKFLNFYRELGISPESIIEFCLTSCNKNILNENLGLENFDLNELSSTNNFDFSLDLIYKTSKKKYKDLSLDQKANLGYFYINHKFRNENVGSVENFKNFIKEFEDEFRYIAEPAIYFENFYKDPNLEKEKFNFSLEVALVAKRIMEIILKNKGELILSDEEIDSVIEGTDVDIFQISEVLRTIIFGIIPFKFNLSKSIWFLGEEVVNRRIKSAIDKIKA